MNSAKLCLKIVILLNFYRALPVYPAWFTGDLPLKQPVGMVLAQIWPLTQELPSRTQGHHLRRQTLNINKTMVCVAKKGLRKKKEHQCSRMFHEISWNLMKSGSHFMGIFWTVSINTTSATRCVFDRGGNSWRCEQRLEDRDWRMGSLMKIFFWRFNGERMLM